MDEIEELRRKLREAESRVQQEQRRREEEQRRRELAEELTEASQPQILQHYLEACHSLNLGIQVVTAKSLTTQGDTTNPAGRIFPRRIIPWTNFATRQEEVWDDLSTGNFFSLPAFPSQHQLEYVKSLIKPISSELGLRYFEHNVVENAVQKLVDGAYMDPLLRCRLGLRGTVRFESHTNLGTTDDDPTSEPLENMSLDSGDSGAVASASALQPTAPKVRRRARGKGNRADQFCIYSTSDGDKIPALAIEYKAPHKLGVNEVVTGLASEIQPERDVINQDGQGFAFTAKALAAAVVTQLFSYMVGKGIQYGYVCTGQAFVFLHIPDEPSNVYFSVCVPNLDVMDDDETKLHRTAVAQVFAFILQALRARPPPESWHDEAERLDTWAVEYDDVLRKIPETERRRKEPRVSPYKPQRWKGFKRSPIRTRSRCQQMDVEVRRLDDDDEDPPSPTPNPARTTTKAAPQVGSGSRGGGKRGRREGERRKRQDQGQTTKPDIQNRPFCTQHCLLGLAYGGPMDKSCPNANYHGQGHIKRVEFLRLIRGQLAIDRGHDADCTPLHRSGARGSLFKVRLSSHGYTLVAKGVESLDHGCLQHENEVYDRLRPIQGKHVPVCLGNINLVRPYYYDSGVYVHFMFLGWAGQPLFDGVDKTIESGIDDAITTMLKAVHGFRVLHCDAEPRNILYDTDSGRLMLVDFERAEFRGRQPFSSMTPNVQSRKGKRTVWRKQRDDFAKELECAVYKASRCVASLSTK